MKLDLPHTPASLPAQGCPGRVQYPTREQSNNSWHWTPLSSGVFLTILLFAAQLNAAGVCIPDLSGNINNLSSRTSILEGNVIDLSASADRTRRELLCMIGARMEWGCAATHGSMPTAPSSNLGRYCWCRVGEQERCPASSWVSPGGTTHAGSSYSTAAECVAECEGECWARTGWRFATTWRAF